MFGLETIMALNDAAHIRALMEKQEDFIYTVDEIVTDEAYRAGWRMDDNGEWTTEHGDEVDNPLDCLMRADMPNRMRVDMVDAIIEAFKSEYGETPEEEEDDS